MAYPKHRNTPDKYIIEPELIWALYWGEDMSCAEIAKLFDCDGSTITWKMRRYGIPRKDAFSNHTKVKISKEELDELYWKQELTLEKIAEIHSCSAERIGNLLKVYDIPIKTMGNYDAWNKGLKGIHLNPKNEFKKGLIPWNTGITGKNSHSWIHGKYEYICKWCGKPFSVYDKHREFCSINCSAEYHKGENGSNWQGGKVPINQIERRRKEVNEWRKQIFSRDDYTCQYCHDRNGNGKSIILNAHHIKAWKDYPDERFNIDNGITLCKSCHFYVHHIDILSQQ